MVLRGSLWMCRLRLIGLRVNELRGVEEAICLACALRGASKWRWLFHEPLGRSSPPSTVD